MSQHLAMATLDGHPVEIVAGFDRRLGDYFLQVIDERNDMLYTSLQEPLLDWTRARPSTACAAGRRNRGRWQTTRGQPHRPPLGQRASGHTDAWLNQATV